MKEFRNVKAIAVGNLEKILRKMNNDYIKTKKEHKKLKHDIDVKMKKRKELVGLTCVINEVYGIYI